MLPLTTHSLTFPLCYHQTSKLKISPAIKDIKTEAKKWRRTQILPLLLHHLHLPALSHFAGPAILFDFFCNSMSYSPPNQMTVANTLFAQRYFILSLPLAWHPPPPVLDPNLFLYSPIRISFVRVSGYNWQVATTKDTIHNRKGPQQRDIIVPGEEEIRS